MERIDNTHRREPSRGNAAPRVLVCLLASTVHLQTEMRRIGEAWQLHMPRAEFVVITEPSEVERPESEVAAALTERCLSTERLLLVAHGAGARRMLALIFSNRRRICRGILAYGACPLPPLPGSCSGRGIQLRLIEGDDAGLDETGPLAASVRALQLRDFDVRAGTLPGSVERLTADAVRLGGAYLGDMVATSLASYF